MAVDRNFLVAALETARTKLEGCGGRNVHLAEHVDALQARLDEHDRQYAAAFPDSNNDKLLTETKALDEAYASATGPAEAYERDLRTLVQAVRAVIKAWDADGPVQTMEDMRTALEQFEPWLEQDEDPRSMGWVDDKGRP